jgi:hypothetical protein
MGQLIASHIVATYPAVKITGIVRNAFKVPAKFSANSNITIIQADSSDKVTIAKALSGSQVCICCYSGDKVLMIDGQKLLIDACIEVGVPRYVASDWGGDYQNTALGEVPMKDPSKIIYAYLQEKQAAIRGIHILNGAFTEVIFARTFADAAHTQVQCFGTGDIGIDTTTMPDAAAWTVEAAMDPNATGVIKGLNSFPCSVTCQY